jgi:hypothetical protein
MEDRHWGGQGWNVAVEPQQYIKRIKGYILSSSFSSSCVLRAADLSSPVSLSALLSVLSFEVPNLQDF